MTLIVTTSASAIRLDPTATHYEKYLKGDEKKFVVEYDPADDNILNIYTENLQKTKGKMKMTIKDVKEEEIDDQKINKVYKYLIRDNEAINLNEELNQIEVCMELNCELQITIKNELPFEIEQSMTLLH